MNFFQRIEVWRNKSGPGVSVPPPQKGIKRLFFLLGTHFFKLVRLNLLFLVFCLPIITIPAAYLGMTRVIMNLVRNGNCFLWNDFWLEFKENIFRGMLIGIVAGAIVTAFYYFPVLLGFVATGTGIAFGIGIFIYIIRCYAFPLMTTVQLTAGTNIKNACALVSIEWKRTLLLAVLSALFWVPVIMFLPYTIPVMLFLWFALSQLVVCIIVNEPIQQRIIDPHEHNVNIRLEQ